MQEVKNKNWGLTKKLVIFKKNNFKNIFFDNHII